MARPNLKKRSRKTPASKTTSKVAKRSVSRVLKRETLRQAAIAHNNSNSPLLRLPAEIRNQIYDYVIGGHRYNVHPKPFGKTFYTQADNNKYAVRSRWRDQTALSRTCRQFHYDTGLLVFRNNVFQTYVFENSSDMNKWLCSLQPVQASAIQTIVWEQLGLYVDFGALTPLLASWKGIKRVGLAPSYQRVLLANHREMKTAGFEPYGTAELKHIAGETFITWYDRSS